MAFSGNTFTKLYNWLTDPQRNEKIFNSRLDDEFGGIATGLTTVATNLAVVAIAKKPGEIVQVSQAAKLDTFSTASTTLVDITGMTAAITPTSATSLIKVSISLNHCTDTGANAAVVALLRNGSNILGGTATSTRPSGIAGVVRTTDGLSLQVASFVYYDSPASTSALTYKLQALVQSGGTYFVNRTATDTDAIHVVRASSHIVLEELLV